MDEYVHRWMISYGWMSFVHGWISFMILTKSLDEIHPWLGD
jgi:hypothetical protein